MDDRSNMDAIGRGLQRLRRRLMLWQCGVAASRFLAALAALAFLSLFIDRSARMDHTQRTLSLTLGLAVLLWALWRWVARPFRHRISSEALLQHIERRQPELAGRMITAWEFAAMPHPPPGVSPALVASAIEQGRLAGERADFHGVLDWPGFRRRSWVGGVALVALLALAFGAPHILQLWFARNILLRDVEWPRRTRLHVLGLVDGVLRVPVAGDLELRVRAEGTPPGEVAFRYADNSGVAYGEQMPLVGEDYRKVFRGVTEAFRLQISGGDDRTGWIPVQLLPRSEITDVTVTVEPPDYTGRKRATLDVRSGTYAAPAGSRVTLAGRASLPLREVEVAIEGTRLQRLLLSNAVSFRIDLPPAQVKTATYRLQAVSAGGIPTLRPTPVGLRVEPDRPPRVAAWLEGVGPTILPGAALPVAGELQDDYGVASAWVEYQCQSPTGRSSGVLQAPLSLPAAAATGGAVHVSHVLDVTPLGLDADATLSLRVGARDGNTLSGPGQSLSASFTLRVATEEEFRKDLIRREQTLRQRLESLIQEQSALVDESKLFHAGTEDLDDHGAWRFLQAEKRQRQVAPALAVIVASIAQIRDEAYNNHLEPEPSPLRTRLEENALQPLRDVAERLLPEAGDRVSAAREVTDATERRAAWRAAYDAQQLVMAALQNVRDTMLASADVSELMRVLDEILADQSKVNQNTARKAAGSIEKVFEP